VIRKRRAAKLYFFVCEKRRLANKIAVSGPDLEAIRAICDCQPANNELQRIGSRRNKLMKLSLSLALVGAMVFLSACEEEPPVRSTRHPSRYSAPPPQSEYPPQPQPYQNGPTPPPNENVEAPTQPAVTEFPCRTSLALSPALTRPIKATWTSVGFLLGPKSKTRTQTRSFLSPDGSWFDGGLGMLPLLLANGLRRYWTSPPIVPMLTVARDRPGGNAMTGSRTEQ
jgi:hypothetical protein